MQRIGIVGRGSLAKAHVERYGLMPNAEVIAVTARSSPSAFVERYAPEATAYADATRMFDQADLDAVDVCAPTDTHTDLAVAAADRGLDMCFEAPIGRTLADAEALSDAVAEADVTCLVGHAARFSPAYETTRHRVGEGAVGDVGNLRTFRQAPAVTLDDWHCDRSRSGGVILDLAIHDFDFLRRLCGDVERAFARRRSRNGSEYSLTTLRFANGAVGHVDARWSSREDASSRSRFEIAGDDGLIEYDSRDSTPFEMRGSRGSDASRNIVDNPLARNPCCRHLDRFVECLEEGTEPAVGVDGAIDSLRIGLAALESADSGRRVAPSDLST